MGERKVGRNKSGRFTKGNNFGEGRGSPGKYKNDYAKQLLEYFSDPPTRVEYIKHYNSLGEVTKEEPVVVGADYPTFEGFANKIGVTSRTLENWRDKYPTFADAYERAIDLQKNMLVVNSLGGRYNGNFAKFIASNAFGMSEKSEHKVASDEGVEVFINVKAPDKS